MTRKGGAVALSERLESRRLELEQAILNRVYGVADFSVGLDPEYAEGVRASIHAAVDYGLSGIESGEEPSSSVPLVLLSQARLAARNGVRLDTVLRCYFAGYALFCDFLIEEAGRENVLRSADMKYLLRAQAAPLDRLLVAVSEEHVRETQCHHDTSEQRRTEHVRRLLAGELINTVELSYDLDAHHLGVIANGPGAEEAIRDLARALDRRLLLIRRGEGMVWVWLGGRRPVDPEFEKLISKSWPVAVSLAIGEPARGLAGWRLTHRQACAALPVALRGPQRRVRYADVALLASMLQDDLLETSLRQLYLDPLSRERDGGNTLRETLRAYFVANRSLSSAAGILSVSRQTVANRLQSVEERLGCYLTDCAAELEAALRLDGFGERRGSALTKREIVGRSFDTMTKRSLHEG